MQTAHMLYSLPRIFNELQIKAKTTLDHTSKWFLVNCLTLNMVKTNTVKFSSKHYQGETFPINYQNNSIKESIHTNSKG